jgi:hypothetical protein
MKNYKKYISEIKKIEMKPVKLCPESDHFQCVKNISPEDLEALMSEALADLKILPLSKVKQELEAIKHLEEAFSELDTDYPGLFRKFKKGNLTIRELAFRLKPLFGYVRIDSGTLTAKCMVGLYISILTKHNSILVFRRKIRNLLTRHLSQSVEGF